MKFLLLILLALTVIAFVIGTLRDMRLRKQKAAGVIDEMPQVVMASEAECCGRHDSCEKLRVIMAHKRDEVIYYDDEELDVYKDRAADDFTESETAEFRDVLTTMSDSEVEGWLVSLRIRHINVPEGLRHEVSEVMRRHHAEA